MFRGFCCLKCSSSEANEHGVWCCGRIPTGDEADELNGWIMDPGPHPTITREQLFQVQWRLDRMERLLSPLIKLMSCWDGMKKLASARLSNNST